MAKINLTKNAVAIVDASDFGVLSSRKWQLHSGGYAISNGKILMHRAILGAKKGQEIDHINRNKLDNRRSNLRFVTRSENQLNLPAQKNAKVKYKGVSLETRTGKYYSQLCIKGERHHLGTFDTPKLAYKAYLNARRELL
jgi:hypothetical protein